VPPRKAASPELNLPKFACLFLSANTLQNTAALL
jgi:hypothetical protein